MNFLRHNAYKDADTICAKEIPVTWEAARLGFEAETLVPMRDKPERLDGEVPWIRIEDFQGKYISTSKSGQGVSEDTISSMNLKVFPAGTVLCSCSCSMGATAITAAPLVSNQTFIGIVPGRGYKPEYLYYLLQASSEHLNSIGTGAIQSYLSRDDFRRLRLPKPPITEQDLIGNFLDRETAKIDALIAEQQRLIELLQEKRQAVISHAVTKGLNPNAPMKDAGVEWLGEVPGHWRVSEARREIEFLTSGSRGWADFYSDEGPIFLRIANLTRDKIELKLDNIQRVSPPIGAEGARTEVKSGDVLFSITAYLGSVAVVPTNFEKAYVSQHVCLARLNRLNLSPKWLAYSVLSSSGKAHLEANSYGGTKVQLGLDDIKSFPLAFPSPQEQEEIIKKLEESLRRLDELKSKANENIDLLQERRSALISAAVTGQIDIRGLVSKGETT